MHRGHGLPHQPLEFMSMTAELPVTEGHVSITHQLESLLGD